ncbi:MAG: sigma-70 family RNA polymerase sigma factor [Gemmataceae bacterium]
MDTRSDRTPYAPTDAVTLLADRHAELVAMLVRLRFSRHDAEDAVQNAAVVCLRHARSGRDRPVANLDGWLRVVVLRAAYRVARRRLRGDPAALDQLAAREADEVERRDEASAVCRAIRRLPRKLRDTLCLCTFDGLTYEEAAPRLGVSVGQVGRRLNQARAELTATLAATLRGGRVPAGV